MEDDADYQRDKSNQDQRTGCGLDLALGQGRDDAIMPGYIRAGMKLLVKRGTGRERGNQKQQDRHQTGQRRFSNCG